MNAKDLFPDEEERKQVKEWLDLFNGTIVKVVDADGKILFDT
jgi:hypothetical protein